MTDKQIIIDGCDVSGCINFRSDIDTPEISYINACSIGLWQGWYSNLEPSCIMSCSCKDNPNCYYKQLKRAEQKLAKIEKLLEPIKCKHPEDCWENKPDWNGEVYGCEPDDMDNIASCPSKVATSVLQIIEGKENGI